MRATRTIAICFFVSGFAGLIYEVSWVKMLRLLFGSTVLAVSTILAVYFTGLALGSYIFGKLADRRRCNPIRLYAILELVIAGACLISPVIFALLRNVYASFVADRDFSFETGALLKLGFAFVALIGPTTLLGGTLPLVVKGLSSGKEGMGHGLARLYGLNTLGAVLGTLAAGFLFLPLLGIQLTLVLAAAADIVVGLLALRIASSFSQSEGEKAPDESTPKAKKVSEKEASPEVKSALPAFVTGAAGFTSLGLEILLSRAIVTLTGSTVYAFSLILAVFLFGIGLGSSLVSRFTDRIRSSPGALGILLSITGLLTFAITHGYRFLPDLRQWCLTRFGYDFQVDLLLVVFFAALLLLPLTLVFGALFPLCTRLATRDQESLGSSLGLLYAVNTFSGIGGSILVGFVLLPKLGVLSCLAVLAWINLGVGILSWLLGSRSSGPRRMSIALPLLILGIALTLLLPRWDQTRLNNNIVLGNNTDTESVEEVLYYADGVDATVSVIASEGLRKLYVNGTIQAANDNSNVRLYDILAHLPLLLAPRTESVLVIGLGSGITLGTTSVYKPDTLHCVEISRDVVEGAKYFAKENRSILENPRLTLIHDDARSYLFTKSRSYDVITANAFLPSNAGTGALYAVEHFKNCREHLTEGGILCQWVPLFALSTDDLKCVTESFRTAFPESTLWFLSGYAMLIGSKGPLSLDYQRLKERFHRVQSQDRHRLDTTRIRSLDQLLGLCLLGPEQLASIGKGAALNTDDRPLIEYSAPRHIDFRTNLPMNIDLLLSKKTASFPLSRSFAPPPEPGIMSRIQASYLSTGYRAAYHAAIARGSEVEALTALQNARATKTSDPLADEILATHLSDGAQVALAAGDLQTGIARLEEAARLDPTTDRKTELGLALGLSGAVNRAVGILDDVLTKSPDHVKARLNLGALLANAGRFPRARRELETVLKLSPDHVQARLHLAAILAQMGEAHRAKELILQALTLEPKNAEALEKLEAVEELLKTG